jgi:hypothetical protein
LNNREQPPYWKAKDFTIAVRATVSYIFEGPNRLQSEPIKAIRVFHISLLVFWVTLIAAGLIKGILTQHHSMPFREIMQLLSPFFVVFALAGFTLFGATIWIVKPILKIVYQNRFQQNRPKPSLVR